MSDVVERSYALAHSVDTVVGLHDRQAEQREQPLVSGMWLAVSVGESFATDEVRQSTTTRFAVRVI